MPHYGIFPSVCFYLSICTQNKGAQKKHNGCESFQGRSSYCAKFYYKGLKVRVVQWRVKCTVGWYHLIICRHWAWYSLSIVAGKAGRSLKPVHVVVVGTHADCICAGNNSAESTATVLLESVSQKFDDLLLGSKMFSVNALEAMSYEMKALRSALSELKTKICQVLQNTRSVHKCQLSQL